LLRQLIEQNHIEQRLVHLDAAVVIDKAELAKAVHDESDAGSRRSDHLRQGFLRNGRNEGWRFAMGGMKVGGSPGLLNPPSIGEFAPGASRWS
jgi:hypothetical protein